MLLINMDFIVTLKVLKIVEMKDTPMTRIILHRFIYSHTTYFLLMMMKEIPWDEG